MALIPSSTSTFSTLRFGPLLLGGDGLKLTQNQFDTKRDLQHRKKCTGTSKEEKRSFGTTILSAQDIEVATEATYKNGSCTSLHELKYKLFRRKRHCLLYLLLLVKTKV
jgi:hypothetical protein